MSHHRPTRHQKTNTPADRTRWAFYCLATDWVHLRLTFPKPSQGAPARRNTSRVYGHPAEWASDKSAKIAAILTSWHDLLAEKRNETRPVKGLITALDLPGKSFEARIIPAPTSEQRRVVAAWRYLEPRFEYLVEIVGKEDLDEISTLHNQIVNILGKTNPKITLPYPCPNPECELKTLQRDIRIGTYGYITCGSCGHSTREEAYRIMLRLILDTLIDAA